MFSLCLPSANKGMLKFRSARLIKRLCPAMFCKSVIATLASASSLSRQACAQTAAPARPQIVMPDAETPASSAVKKK